MTTEDANMKMDQDEQEPHRSNMTLTNGIWTLITQKKGSHDTYERLKDLNSVLAATSGLIAGFTFLVTNTPIEWKYAGYIPKDTRSDLFGALLMVGLIVSLLATLLATTNYGFINLIGPDQEKLFTDFVTRNRRCIGLPITLLTIAILVMLLGACIAIGGLYSAWVQVLYIILTLTGIVLIMSYIVYNQSALVGEYEKILKPLPDYIKRHKNSVFSQNM
eukprot:969623_1